MYIAIDSSNQLRFTGTVSGSYFEISNVYKEISKILKNSGINPPFHWSKISRKVKESNRKDIAEVINKSKLNFNIFQHTRPQNMSRKELFFIRLPNAISQNLENWLRYKHGQVDLEVDDDYNFSRTSGTKKFLENLIFTICFRLVGKPVKVRVNNIIRSTIKQDNGVILEFYGTISDANSSKGIQIIDLVIGFVLENKNMFQSNKIFFKKIC